MTIIIIITTITITITITIIITIAIIITTTTIIIIIFLFIIIFIKLIILSSYSSCSTYSHHIHIFKCCVVQSRAVQSQDLDKKTSFIKLLSRSSACGMYHIHNYIGCYSCGSFLDPDGNQSCLQNYGRLHLHPCIPALYRQTSGINCELSGVSKNGGTPKCTWKFLLQWIDYG